VTKSLQFGLEFSTDLAISPVAGDCLMARYGRRAGVRVLSPLLVLPDYADKPLESRCVGMKLAAPHQCSMIHARC
jgi:hypothetical protein